MAYGWIKLSRQIQEHWLWKGESFDKAHAWIDLLLLANHEDVKTYFNGRIVTCKRGTISRSIYSLADRWNWSRKKVAKFLDVLESDGMVATKRTTEGTTITIVNYEVFQTSGATDCTTYCTTKELPRNTNKNDKNDKEIKNIYKHPKMDQFSLKEKQDYDFDSIEKMLDGQ